PQEDPAPQRWRLSKQRCCFNRQAIRRCGGQFPVAAGGQLIEPLRVLARQPRGACNRGTRRAVGGTVQFGQHDVADTVPRVLEVVVRFVVDPTFAAAGEVAAQVRARDVEQRANDAAAPRMNARKASEPGAANQLQEKRLRLIVLRVADRDAVGAQRVGRVLHKVVSDPAGRIFDRQVPAAGVRLDVLVLHNDSQSDTARQIAAERLVAVGRRRWFKWAIPASVKLPFSANSRSRKRRATESEPPDRPISTRVPWGQSAWRAMVFWTRWWTPVSTGQAPRSKIQAPNSDKPQMLSSFWSLELGAWNLELFGIAGGQTRTADPALMRRVL